MENQQMALMTVLYLIIVLYIIFVTITKKISFLLNFAFVLILVVPFVYLYKTDYFSNLENLRKIQPDRFYMILFIFGVGVFATFYGILNARIYPSSAFLIITSIFFVFLAIIYKITQRSVTKVFTNVNKNKNNTGISKTQAWALFIYKFIFYIPCLLIELIEYINKDFNSVNNTIYNLLAILIILIIVYFYNEKMLTYLSNNDDSVQIINEPLYLNRHQNMGSVASYKINPIPEKKIHESNTTDTTDIINYTISTWVFINPTPSNYKGYTNESNIFRVGAEYTTDIYVTSKPALIYVNIKDETSQEHYGVYRLYFTGGNPKDIIEFRTKDQKWNLITITMSNTVDVFVNGELIASKNRVYNSLKNTERTKANNVADLAVVAAEDAKAVVAAKKVALDAAVAANEAAIIERNADPDADRSYTDTASERKAIATGFAIISAKNDVAEATKAAARADDEATEAAFKAAAIKEYDYQTPVLGTDTFIVGGRNGLDGAICNTIFYPRILTQQEILSHHLMLSQLNPPIFFIKK